MANVVAARSKDIKACHACASSKRRCTKTLPRCQRCEVRGLDCVYATKPRYIIYHDQTRDVDTGLYGACNHFEMNGTQSWPPRLPTPPYSLPRSLAPVDASLDDLRSAWFLTPDAWSVSPLDVSALAPINMTVLQSYVCKAQEWLKEWVTTGSNPFIHPELYSRGMPACVQDAFMVLSMYLARTDKTRDLVLRLVQEKAEAFVAAEVGQSPENMVQEIGRVQALLVYSLIRLFDGDIRQRHLAEEHLPILVNWAEDLREHATRATATAESLLNNPLTQPLHNLQTPHPGTTSSRRAEELLWKAWILSESIRRTWYIALLVNNGYWIIKTGAVTCRGSIPVTTRMGVWQARTADAWLRTCAENNVGFANRNEAEALIEGSKAEEVDGFTLALMEVDFGPERIEGWKYGR